MDCPLLTLPILDSHKTRAVDFYTITPTLAAYVLKDRNPTNRDISPVKLAQAVHDVMHGDFILNGESIIFSDEGMLLDGQHRLAACVEADKPITSTVVMGMPPSVRDTVDQGKARTTGDTLGMNGVTNGNICASVAKFLLGYYDGDGTGFGRTGHYSKAEAKHWIKAHPETVVHVTWAMTLKTASTAFVTASQMALVRSLLEPKYGKSEVVYFLERVADGLSQSTTEAAYVTRKRLLTEKHTLSLQRKRVGNFVAVEILMRGFLAHHLKKPITKIQLMGVLPAIAKTSRPANATARAEASAPVVVDLGIPADALEGADA